MTNDFNDLDHNELNHEDIPQKQGVGANLAEAWRSRPIFKLTVIMVIVISLGLVCFTLFSGSRSTTGNVSSLVRPPEMHEAPGGNASPNMQRQTEMANDQRTQQALATGGDVIPTPIGNPTNVGDMSASSGKSDELKQLEAEIEHQKEQLVQVQQQQVQPQQQAQPQQFDDSLAQAMQHQMTQLMDSWTPHGIKEVTVTKIKEADTGSGTSSGSSGSSTTASAAPSSTTAQQVQPKTIVSAGTVSYAQLLTEANSDVPGPILAQIVSGPLAGARAVGSFQVANGYSDYLVLQFTVANLKGKDYMLNAIALDPDTTLGGMATEVDQRYFTRVILPAAAGFLQGFGGALGTGNSSITSSGDTTIVTQSGRSINQGLYTGLSQGAQTMSQFFQNQANLTKPLVRVAAGTPMGMFFVSTVTDQAQNQAGTYPQAGYPGMPGYGFPGTGMPYGTYPGGAYPGAGQTGYYPGSTLAGYGAGTSGVPYPNYSSIGSPIYNSYPGSTGYNGAYNAGTAGIATSPYGTPLYGR